MIAEHLTLAELNAEARPAPPLWQNRTQVPTAELLDDLDALVRRADDWQTATWWAVDTGRPRHEWYSKRLQVQPTWRPTLAEARRKAEVWFGITLKTNDALRMWLRDARERPRAIVCAEVA